LVENNLIAVISSAAESLSVTVNELNALKLQVCRVHRAHVTYLQILPTTTSIIIIIHHRCLFTQISFKTA